MSKVPAEAVASVPDEKPRSPRAGRVRHPRWIESLVLGQPASGARTVFLLLAGAVGVADVGSTAAATEAPVGRMAMMLDDAQADGVSMAVTPDAASEASVLLAAGRPLKEPIVQAVPS